MISEIVSAILVGIINSTITIYTYTTLPIYYLIQRPWNRLKLINAIRAAPEDPLDPYSAWRRVGTSPTAETLEVDTIDQMLVMAALVFGKDYQIAGVKTKSGKKLSYKWFNYGQLIQRVDNIAKGLKLIGIEKGDKVLIFAETRLEWLLCALALYRLGAVMTTLFAQLGIDGIIHSMNQTKVKYAITTDLQLKKLRSVLSSTPSLQKIVSIDEFDKQVENVEIMSLRDVESNGINSDIRLSKKSLNRKDDIAVIMYTSGTTGNPKGVIATHGQMIAAAKANLCILGPELKRIKNHIYVSYLPLGHMFEFVAEIFNLGVGLRMGYASSLTLIDGAPNLSPGDISDIRLLKPTIFITVPLVLDRIRRGVLEQVESGPLSRRLFKCLTEYKSHWVIKGYNTSICNYFLCRKAKEQLGGNLNFCLVGGAPMSPETEKLIALVFDVKLLQGFGGTEVCGASHCTDLQNLKYGRTGPPLYGFKVRLVDWPDAGYLATDKPNPRGEIVVNGDAVTEGYYMMDKETTDTFRYENGEKWYYTGDIGEIESDGSFKIIDRRKDLLKLQNGEYFSLGKIEAAVKSCQFVDNICVHGNATHDFLIAIVVPNQKVVETLAEKFGLQNLNFQQLCRNNKIENTISKAIKEYGKQNGLSKREIPAKIMLCSDQWTPDNGLLTAALKLKRILILNTYKKEILQMFSEDINNNKV